MPKPGHRDVPKQVPATVERDISVPVWETTDQFSARIWRGDVLEVLRTIPSQSVQTVITSPPYWGLRSYLDKDHADKIRELGSEKVCDCLGWARGENCAERDWGSACHTCRMVLVFREVRRVLRNDGTLWCNYGDTYASGNCGGESVFANGRTDGKSGDGGIARTKESREMMKTRGSAGMKPFLPSGNLVGVPWRVAFALQADGWVLRQDIIWCLSGGTWVYVKTQKGEMPMMVSDMSRLDPSTVKLWNGQKWTQVLGWSCSIRKGNEIELVLRSGERISCSVTHQFPTSRGLLSARDIRCGDVLTSTKLPEPNEPHLPEAITLDAAWFIGLYLAEGSRTDKADGNSCLQLAGHIKETERWERVQKIVKYYGGTASLSEDGNKQVIRVYSRVLTAIIDDHTSGRVAKNKGLKVRCWAYRDEWLMELLLGYLSGDGGYDTANDRWRLGFCRNYNWERDLRVLAGRLGFRLVLNPTTSEGFGSTFPSFRGEIRFNWSNHHNCRNPLEVVEIRNARCRTVYDIGVEDEPHLFALASGVLTHNCKPSPMPESVKNRCTKAHEYVFLFSKKSGGYFYDAEAIKEQATAKAVTVFRGENDGPSHYVNQPDLPDNSAVFSRSGNKERKSALERGCPNEGVDGSVPWEGNTANKRSVWSVASGGYSGAHFATFPTALIEPMILAGSSEHGACSSCGAPFKRVTEDKKLVRERPNDYTKRTGEEGTGNSCSNSVAGVESKTVGWSPTCSCSGIHVEGTGKKLKSLRAAKGIKDDQFQVDAAVRAISGAEWSEWQNAEHGEEDYVEVPVEEHVEVDNLVGGESPGVRPCVVLDPFLGSGTTTVTALKHGRAGWGIELSEKYVNNHAIPRVESRLLDLGMHHLVPRSVDTTPPDGVEITFED